MHFFISQLLASYDDAQALYDVQLVAHSLYTIAVVKKSMEELKMNYTIRYYSKSGNTKKLADALANALNIESLTIDTPVTEKNDILFLGASVYWAGIDPHVKDFIKTLDPNKVKSVAVFSTSAMSERAYPQIKKLIEAQGITCLPQNFYCRGQFTMMHRGHPNAKDLEDLKIFARSFK